MILAALLFITDDYIEDGDLLERTEWNCRCWWNGARPLSVLRAMLSRQVETLLWFAGFL
jgi:hypothetical protein